MKKWILSNWLYFIGAVVGALGGFLYWRYVGCVTGTCAITSSPVNSTLYFGSFGAILLGGLKREKVWKEKAK
jgi:hypothetical protein